MCWHRWNFETHCINPESPQVDPQALKDAALDISRYIALISLFLRFQMRDIWEMVGSIDLELREELADPIKPIYECCVPPHHKNTNYSPSRGD